MKILYLISLLFMLFQAKYIFAADKVKAVFDVLGTTIDIDPKIQFDISKFEVFDGDTITVSVSGVSNPNKTDVIAIYTPPGENSVKSIAPSKFRACSQDADYLSTGKATFKQYFTSSRQDYQVAIIKSPLSKPVVKGLSKIIKLLGVNQPLQGHLGTTGKNTEMVIQWNTRDINKPLVRYGTNQYELKQVKQGSSKTYTPADLCGAPANTTGFVSPGYYHTAIMTKLTPGQKYFYQYGSEDQGCQFSPVYSFNAFPKVGSEETVRYFVIADIGMNSTDGWSYIQNEPSSLTNTQRMIKRNMNEHRTLFHVHGDLAYGDGVSVVWDRFFQMLSPLWTSMPVVFTEGNHEKDWPGKDRYQGQATDSGGECGVVTYTRSYLTEINKGNAWYSFNYGPFHFTHFSSEQDFSVGSPQYNFITSDIKKVDRSRTPWLILAGHRPFYPDSDDAGSINSDQTVAQDLRDSLEDFINKYRVDLVWNGHTHQYVRTCPLYKMVCQENDQQGVPKAPMYITLGHAGRKLDDNQLKPETPYDRVVVVDYGYTTVDGNKTHLTQTSYYASNDTVMDSYTIEKPKGWGKQFMKSMNA